MEASRIRGAIQEVDVERASRPSPDVHPLCPPLNSPPFSIRSAPSFADFRTSDETMILSPGQLLAPVSFLLRFLLSLDDRSSDHLSLLPLALDGHLNANAASSSPHKAGDEGFDGRGGSYPANAGCLPTGSWVDEGIKVRPAHDIGADDV